MEHALWAGAGNGTSLTARSAPGPHTASTVESRRLPRESHDHDEHEF